MLARRAEEKSRQKTWISELEPFSYVLCSAFLYYDPTVLFYLVALTRSDRSQS